MRNDERMFWLIGLFSWIKKGQTPENYFLLRFLSTFHTEGMRDLVQSTKKNLSILNKSEKEILIEVHPYIKAEILGNLPMKSKQNFE